MTPTIRNCNVRVSQSGFTLVEAALALSILAVGVLSVSLTLMRGMRYQQSSFEAYRAVSGLQNVVAQVQETANKPQNISGNEGIGSVYATYHGATFQIPDLDGMVSVECFPNETTVPAEFGGPQDLNFDGDADDDLGNTSRGTDLKLVPMTLTASFTTSDGIVENIVIHRLMTKTSK